MKSLNALAAAIAVGLSLCSIHLVRADLQSPPQTQLKSFALPKDSKSADISPDERFVVTDSTQKKTGADSAANPYSDFVQLWSIKDERLVGEFSELSPDTRIFTHPRSGTFVYPPNAFRIVRFSPDGKTVLALIGHTIHVLRSQDLAEIRTISLSRPEDETQTVHGKAVVNIYDVHSTEISPDGNLLAVLWVARQMVGKLPGKVQLYDLATGVVVATWNTPTGWLYYSGRLRWHPNGKLILIPIPNSEPCRYANHRPDVFAFDKQTGDVKYELTTGLQIGGIAVASDSRVLAVQTGCFQRSKSTGRLLEVFDLDTGKHLRNVSGRETGMLYSVSISADGNRFIAFTGNTKTKYDWLDGTSYGVTVDETFSVWNLTNYDEIVTSQNIPGLKDSELTLSSTGKYALSSGKASFVFTLP